MTTTVHLYSRFSHQSQSGGDSTRRQLAAAEAFCKRHGFRLSEDRYHDAGRSGWKRTETGGEAGRLVGKQQALHAFMRAVDAGSVRPGDVLLVENLDRLSRKGIKSTRQLIDKILDTGVRIAILHPSEKIYDNEGAEGDIGAAIELASLAFTAHQYSVALSNRVSAAYQEHRRCLTEGKPSRFASGKRWASMHPSWLEWDEQRQEWREKPAQVEAIRWAFDQFAAGVGRNTVLKQLNEKFPPPGGRSTSKNWNGSFFSRLLKTRSVLGTLESTHGEVVENYYPGIISEAVWTAANVNAAKQRRVKGPESQYVNILAGLLFSARDGSPMHSLATVSTRLKRDGSRYIYRRFKSWRSIQGVPGADTATMDVARFEDLLFSLLPKLELSSAKPQGDALLNERAYLQTEIDSLQSQIKQRTGSALVLGPVLADLSRQLVAVEARIRESGPRSSAPTAAARKRLSAMRRGTSDERLAVKDAVQLIVRKIEVFGIKMGTRRCDRVRSLVEIEFRNDEFARGLELPDGSMVAIRGPKAHQRLGDQLAAGWEFGPSQYEAAKLATRKGAK